MVQQVLICSIFSHPFQFEVLEINSNSIGSLALTLASSKEIKFPGEDELIQFIVLIFRWEESDGSLVIS